MLKIIHTAVALLPGLALLASPPTRAQGAADRALLATFCEPVSIKGATCKWAKHYPNSARRACDVTLSPDRVSGKFLASANPLLVVNYESGCEAHATDNGGSVVFELVGGKPVFRGFQPGAQVNDCVRIAKDAQQDFLVCLTGHMGQGLLESGVALMNFREDAGHAITIAVDMLVTAEDGTGAYGVNVVTCAEPSKYFALSKLAAGPRHGTVTVDASYADAETIKAACAKGTPRPKEAIGEPNPGDAFMPDGSEKAGKLVIDLATRKVVRQ